MKTLGFGGAFIRTDLNITKEWYQKVFGISFEDWNCYLFNQNREVIFSLFNEDDNYFPILQSFLLNFRVDNLLEFIANIEKLDVKILRTLETSEYGKFIWIEDIDGK